MNRNGRGVFTVAQLPSADLIIDALYHGGPEKNLRAEPLSKLLKVGNVGGFRYIKLNGKVPFCALITTLDEPDWPDSLDEEKGLFTYYGDNRTAGHEIHDTNNGGNRILRDAFNAVHAGRRAESPVFLIFSHHGKGRIYQFRGAAVPGGNGISLQDDLVAIWKADSTGRRYQNYRAIFTILNADSISRAWLSDLQGGTLLTANAPEPYSKWVKTGTYSPLTCTRVHGIRSKAEQLPNSPLEWELLEQLVQFYKSHPQREYAFENCAAKLCLLADNRILNIELTPPRRDGGRDAIGVYRIGTGRANINVEFAMEAKCYPPHTSNGVRLTSRLISRLRHRQFGYFVTTSYVAEQAYREIDTDAHPVVIYAGGDISKILIEAGINSKEKLAAWLQGVDEK